MRSQAAALKALLEEPRLPVMPGCGDGMGARLIEEAGFRTGFVSGSSVSAMRLAMPDMDLVSCTEGETAEHHSIPRCEPHRPLRHRSQPNVSNSYVWRFKLPEVCEGVLSAAPKSTGTARPFGQPAASPSDHPRRLGDPGIHALPLTPPIGVTLPAPIVGAMPFTVALERTGGVDFAVNGLLHLIEEVRFARDSPLVPELPDFGFIGDALRMDELWRLHDAGLWFPGKRSTASSNRRLKNKALGTVRLTCGEQKRARRRMCDHAAATASRHWFAAASARKIRSVERETRWG